MTFEATDAMDFGSLVDSMLLTPSEVGELFVEIPDSVLNVKRSATR
jgi:hypothetical protein